MIIYSKSFKVILLWFGFTIISSISVAQAVSIKNVSQIGPSTLSSGLAGWWTFDGNDLKSNVSDKSGYGNTGYLYGFTSTSTATVAGKTGQGLRFNGNSTYAFLPNYAILNLNSAVTMSAWIYVDSYTTGEIFTYHENGGYRYRINTDGTVTFFDNGGTNYISTTAVIPLHTWTNVVARGDSSGLSIYINGSLSISGGAAFIGSATTANGAIGSSWTGAELFQGIIDDVRVYSRALSVSEIKQLYNSTGGGKINTSVVGSGNLNSSMVAWYTMDGKHIDWSGQTIVDASGNGNTATLLNMTNTENVTPGRIGQALDFKQNAYIRTPLTPLIGTGSYSYTVWFRTSTTQLAGLISQRTNDGFPQFTLSMSNSGVSGPGNLISLVDNDGPQSRQGVTVSSYNDGKWHLAALVRNSGTLTTLVYIDGALAITSNSTVMPDLNSGDNIMIGAAGDGGITANYFFTGFLDDARIYSRALSASEIKSLYNLGR